MQLSETIKIYFFYIGKLHISPPDLLKDVKLLNNEKIGVLITKICVIQITDKLLRS